VPAELNNSLGFIHPAVTKVSGGYFCKGIRVDFSRRADDPVVLVLAVELASLASLTYPQAVCNDAESVVVTHGSGMLFGADVSATVGVAVAVTDVPVNVVVAVVEVSVTDVVRVRVVTVVADVVDTVVVRVSVTVDGTVMVGVVEVSVTVVVRGSVMVDETTVVEAGTPRACNMASRAFNINAVKLA